MSCIATLSNVHELVILQHHAVHATGRSYNMSGIFVMLIHPSSALSSITKWWCCRHCEYVFHFTPTYLIFRSLGPRVIVSCIMAFCLASLFRSEEVVDFILPSFLVFLRLCSFWVFVLWPEIHSAAFPCPSFLWHWCYSHSQSPFHSFVCFDPARIFPVFIRSMTSSVVLFM